MKTHRAYSVKKTAFRKLEKLINKKVENNENGVNF
jgi:hypothetical protein